MYELTIFISFFMNIIHTIGKYYFLLFIINFYIFTHILLPLYYIEYFSKSNK